MDDLTYRVPPDILHYETRYLLGFTIGELMLAAGVALLGMLWAGPLPGLGCGVLGLLAVRRYEGLGGRSLPQYMLSVLRYRWRREEVTLPRLLPALPPRLEVYSWDGDKLFEVGEVGADDLAAWDV